MKNTNYGFTTYAKRSLWARNRKSGKKARRLSKRHFVFIMFVVGALFIWQGSINTRNYNYSGILDTIAKGESNGNYNAYYGNSGNTTIDFTSMTVDEVLTWQRDFVDKGSPSSAVGKYQFIRPTLQGLIDEKNIAGSTIFDAKLQDRLAVALLERRGVNDYMDGKISREQFAYNLSQEWAALPKVIGDRPEESYYAGDGLNKVRVSIAEIYSGMDTLKL